MRDIYAIFPLLIKYVDLHRGFWLKNPIPEAEKVYTLVSDIFEVWVQSQVSWLHGLGSLGQKASELVTWALKCVSKVN